LGSQGNHCCTEKKQGENSFHACDGLCVLLVFFVLVSVYDFEH
jgi:hypothetical protein